MVFPLNRGRSIGMAPPQRHKTYTEPPLEVTDITLRPAAGTYPPANRYEDMTVRDFRRSAHEEWSERNQTLRHAGEKRPRDDRALLHNPYDYSGVGGPDDERVYGRTRSDNGYYPFNPNGGPYDRDVPPSQAMRGGYLKQWAQRSKEWATVAPSPSSARDDRAPPPDPGSDRSEPAKSG
jgi:hypothetical protein